MAKNSISRVERKKLNYWFAHKSFIFIAILRPETYLNEMKLHCDIDAEETIQLGASAGLAR